MQNRDTLLWRNMKNHMRKSPWRLEVDRSQNGQVRSCHGLLVMPITAMTGSITRRRICIITRTCHGLPEMVVTGRDMNNIELRRRRHDLSVMVVTAVTWRMRHLNAVTACLWGPSQSWHDQDSLIWAFLSLFLL